MTHVKNTWDITRIKKKITLVNNFEGRILVREHPRLREI